MCVICNKKSPLVRCVFEGQPITLCYSCYRKIKNIKGCPEGPDGIEGVDGVK